MFDTLIVTETCIWSLFLISGHKDTTLFFL